MFINGIVGRFFYLQTNTIDSDLGTKEFGYIFGEIVCFFKCL